MNGEEGKPVSAASEAIQPEGHSIVAEPSEQFVLTRIFRL
jgi:hypothetical protein